MEARRPWLTPAILATQLGSDQEDQTQSGQKFSRPYLEKNPSQKRAGGVAQGI
jgi:hypothetical protein